MKMYRVVLQIELEAENPLEAANTLKEWIKDGDELIYDVQDDETDELFTVDLTEEDEDAVLPCAGFESIIKFN